MNPFNKDVLSIIYMSGSLLGTRAKGYNNEKKDANHYQRVRKITTKSIGAKEAVSKPVLFHWFGSRKEL